MGDPWRLLATISEPQLCFGREISLKGPLDTVEIVIEYMDMVDNVNMDMIDTVPKRVAKGRQWSPKVSKVQGAPHEWVR